MQVSFDNSQEEWKRAIRFDELPWLSVIDPTFPNSAIAVSYNVQNLPANYLIDKDNVYHTGKRYKSGSIAGEAVRIS